jgi:hypothetical protein
MMAISPDNSKIVVVGKCSNMCYFVITASDGSLYKAFRVAALAGNFLFNNGALYYNSDDCIYSGIYSNSGDTGINYVCIATLTNSYVTFG